MEQIISICIFNSKLQCFEWNKSFFIQKPSGVQTYRGQTLDVCNYLGQFYLLIGNQYNSISSTYEVMSQIYKFSASQTFTLHGEIKTQKVSNMRFYEFNRQLYVTVISSMESCKIYRYDSKVAGRFAIQHDFMMSCYIIELFYHQNKGRSLLNLFIFVSETKVIQR